MDIKSTINSLYIANTNYTDPDQAVNQAESLKSLSNDLYTDSKRFIYELLQNADDSAKNNEKVNVLIKFVDNQLVLAHTGKEFSSRDVKGLCSVNNGTKKSDTTKTGFKGIGFKSVFGQSNKVIIYSNNEYFKFDATHNFGWKDTWEGSQEEWQKENDRDFFYPWQIIPIYLDEKDKKIDINSKIESYLSTSIWKVATIIEILKKDQIYKAIKELLENVNMFLFLKNIYSIKFKIEEDTTTINIERLDNELVLKKNDNIEAKWLIKTIVLKVPDLLKDELKSDPNVPKKLKDTENIELTLAIKKGDHSLEKLSQNENLLYAYLPTDEKRYSLPILVNSTFLTSSNRESLHNDSKWNQWLFKSISVELFKWVAILVKEKYQEQAYRLIPKKLDIKNDNLSKAYNEGIDEAIKSIAFILSKENELLKVEESIIDETSFSEKIFIGKEAVKGFIKKGIGEDNKIVESPFVKSNSNLNKLKIARFSFDNVPAFLASEDFLVEHTIEKNIKLIEYFKNESNISDSFITNDKLKKWAFLFDHKGKLTYPNNIYFPTPDDTTWNNPESDMSFLHEEIQTSLIDKQPTREWLEKLGVIEKTDISFLLKTIIPNASTYVTNDNAIETIQTIYNLYKKENISSHLSELNRLNLLTTDGNLLSASECYFSKKYNPKLEIDTILGNDIFLSEDYLQLDNDKDEIRRFFKFLGVKDEISLLTYHGKYTENNLIIQGLNSDYFNKYSNNRYAMRMHSYYNSITLSYLENTNDFSFSKVFWDHVITYVDVNKLQTLIMAGWGHYGSKEYVENYLQWYIKNNCCIATTKDICEKSTNIFINDDEIKLIAGKYLPVFDGIELNQNWKSFFQFKDCLELEDYLELLTNISNDKNDNNKIKKDNKKRVQLIFKHLLEKSSNWGENEIEKLKSWSKESSLIDDEDNFVLCSELKYYIDGHNSIFQNMHKFIILNEENKSHRNIEELLNYFGIEILRQSNFNIEFEGEKSESDLKYKLESIFPFLIKWIEKIDNDFDIEILEEQLNGLQIEEVSKLSLCYDSRVLKLVKTHLEEDKLLVTTNWGSGSSMLELPKVLCSYFNIKGYEDKLRFLLNTDDEIEIIDYFENEEIELPSEPNLIVNDSPLKEEALVALSMTDKEFDELKKISDSFYHTSESSIDKLEYIQDLLSRSKERILRHLSRLDEYNCDNVDNSALTVLSGIKKNGKDIYIIPRPSDNGKVIVYYPSEIDTLEYADSELWYENGISVPKKLTLGKILRDTKINKIPITKNKKEEIIDILINPKNEEFACEPILPSSLKIAQILASLANTNGGYLIIGYSEESGIIGINSEFNTTEMTQNSISYSDHFLDSEFEEIIVNGKILVTIYTKKSDTDILIEDKKYIRSGSMIKEVKENSNKPLIITEGKTDWKHLKKALSRLQKKGFYTGLDIQFEEYEDINMGDAELDRMVDTYSKTAQSKKHIFMFDRDNNIFVNKYAKERYNNHNNNVYSFCIPKINEYLDRICIEFYYDENDLTSEDINGRRIFIGKEFYPNGFSKCGTFVTEKRKANELDILDRDKKVYLRDDIEWSNNIALSKNDFTNNVINDIEGFNNFEIENFKLIFDVIQDIVNT